MLTVGGKFGDFDVVRELGRGGMGAVYLVRDPGSGDEFAANRRPPRRVLSTAAPEPVDIVKQVLSCPLNLLYYLA